MKTKEHPFISLLWLTSSDPYFTIDDKAMEDLNIDVILNKHLTSEIEEIRPFMEKVPCSIQTIQFRQDILNDMVRNEDFFAPFKRILHQCSEIKNLIKFAFEKEATLYNLLMRIEEVQRVMKLTQELLELLEQADLKSKGLLNLRHILDETIDTDIYHTFKEDIHSIKCLYNGVKSIKLGLNLNENLKPIEAILLSLEEQPFKYSRHLKKTYKIVNLGIRELKSIPRKIFAPESLTMPESLNALEKVMAPAMKQLITFCDQFNSSLLSLFESIKKEIPFYELGISMFKTLKNAGYPLCQPKIANAGVTQIDNFFNVTLAYTWLSTQDAKHMVYNSFSMDRDRNLFILTGANRGGKTTFTQGIGQIYWLAQLGLYIPAEKASLKLIDGLYLHFPSDELKTVYYGRLGEECERFSSLFTQLTSNSLVLMNESFAGTSHLESLTIAEEVIKSIELLGSSLIFNTHLHELSQMIPKSISLVTGTLKDLQSFKVYRGKPLGQSYAKEIACHYGVSYKQLVEY